jgi:hypothetical protein
VSLSPNFLSKYVFRLCAVFWVLDQLEYVDVLILSCFRNFSLLLFIRILVNRVPGQGRVLGSTLTVPDQYAFIINSLFTIFVTAIGGYTWSIICYVFYQFRATQDERDGLYHEKQVILRTGLPATTLLWRFLRLAWAWRSHTSHAFLRTGPLASITLFHILVVLLLGTFSSKVTDTSNVRHFHLNILLSSSSLKRTSFCTPLQGSHSLSTWLFTGPTAGPSFLMWYRM